MEKYLIHSNELHLIDKAKIHQAVEKMVESLDMAAGSTSCFDLYKVVETYFTDLEKRKKMNQLLGITDATEEIEERNYVRISVSDTGIGISESDLPYIFDRFYQVGNEGDEKIGSGIGLHLVREYVNIHGGRIKVDSQIAVSYTHLTLPTNSRV